MSPMFGAIESSRSALDYHQERHNVLASNVANIDTPGFHPLELVRIAEDDPRHSLPVQTTHKQHLGFRGALGDEHEVLEERVDEAGADGNSVSLEREMSKIAANDIRYDAVTRTVRQQIGILRYAASDATSG